MYFEYKAYDDAKTVRSGIVQANNTEEAIHLVGRIGLFPLTVDSVPLEDYPKMDKIFALRARQEALKRKLGVKPFKIMLPPPTIHNKTPWKQAIAVIVVLLAIVAFCLKG